MLYRKVAVFVLLPLAAVSARVQPARRAPEPDLGDFIGSLFGQATGGAGSLFSDVKSEVEKVVDKATSVFNSALASETATSLLAEATKVLGTETSQVFATISTVNGTPIVQVTSVGGPAVTLATESGVTTSFAGHTFTVNTAIPSSTSPSAASSTSSSAAMSSRSLTFSKGQLLSAAGVVGSVFLGTLIVM